jgi:ankyrin repeat protein
MGMCRFTGLGDVEYRKVAAALCRMTVAVSRMHKIRETGSLSVAQRQMLLDSLKFDQIDARHMTIKKGHAKTCKWLSKTPEYIQWLDAAKLVEHHGFLWIKGKPGTGKSTLMKYAHAQAKRTFKNGIVISSFFNARGEDLEKSTIGMYRSLLWQLLEQLPELQRVFDTLGIAALKSGGSHQWSSESLKELFQNAIQQLGHRSLTCFIDALDECEEHQIRDMVSFFEQIGDLVISNNIRFQVCFSSRHYPHITISKGVDLVLEGQEGHNQDITDYLDSELKIGHGKLAEEIRGEIQSKANGIFMWVVLVVQIMNKEHDGGRVHVLRKRLRDIPADLHELLRQILIRDCYNREELLLCIQWILFAKRPLRPEEFYYALLSGVEPRELGPWNAEDITMEVIEKFILSSSKGLAEVTKSRNPTVQFIHESVTDFLVKDNGLVDLFPDLKGNLPGQSHEKLKYCCLNYMGIDFSTPLQLGEDLPKASSEEGKALRELSDKIFPFFEYAVNFVLHHADVAEGLGIAQTDFIQEFSLANWINANNIIEKHDIRRYSLKASRLYILAATNSSNLIRMNPTNVTNGSYLSIEEERYGLPLLAARATGSNEALGAFIDLRIRNSTARCNFREIYSDFCGQRNKSGSLGLDFSFSKRKSILEQLTENGDTMLLTFLIELETTLTDEKNKLGRTCLSLVAGLGHQDVVALLLENSTIDVNSRDIHGKTPLCWAVHKGDAAVVQLFLQCNRVEVNSRDKYGWTPLSFAAVSSVGSTAVVQLLLQCNRVDVNSRENDGRTPLSRAIKAGKTTVVQLLLRDSRVEVNSRDNNGRIPFSWAAELGKVAVIQLFLQRDQVEVNSRDNDGRSPLSWAAQHSSAEVVQLFLQCDRVEVNSRDDDGRTPLSWAAQHSSAELVQLFLQCDRVDVNSRDNNGRSPLSWVAYKSRAAVVQLFLQCDRVEVNSRDNDGRTPLSWAAVPEFVSTAVIQQFLKHNQVEVDSRDNDGRTPLWHAVTRLNDVPILRDILRDVVSLLLASGKVNPSAKDKNGSSPLSIAESERFRFAVMANTLVYQFRVWTNVTESMRSCIEKAKANDAEVCAHLISFILKTDKSQVIESDYPAEDESSKTVGASSSDS